MPNEPPTIAEVMAAHARIDQWLVRPVPPNHTKRQLRIVTIRRMVVIGASEPWAGVGRVKEYTARGATLAEAIVQMAKAITIVEPPCQ
jgi:hypothetical protein